LDESAFIIGEIESNLEKVLKKRKEEVEREFQEKIRREKEESERKKSIIDQEFEKERGTIKEFREAISEFETSRQSLQDQIQDHLERGTRFQRDIEKLAALTLEEFREVGELTVRLAELRQRSEEKVADIRARLKERFGITAEVSEPELKEDNEMAAELEQELDKLVKIQELLETGPGSDRVASGPLPEPLSESLAVPEEPDFAASKQSRSGHSEPEPPRAAFKMPEINQFIEDFTKRESGTFAEPPLKEQAIPAQEEKRAPVEDLSVQGVFKKLEKYRRFELVDDSIEISFFQNGERIALDGEFIIRIMTRVLDNVKKLSQQKPAQMESTKYQFFLKQELINYQEAMREVILRCLKMCEKESCFLPQYTSEILNVTVLKDILEKLNMDNWNNPDDVRSFESFVGQLKDAFYKKITPPASYLKSLIEEIEG
jgi:hypothetical protein